MGKCVALAIVMLVFWAAVPAVSAQVGPPAIPDNLKVPDGNVLLFEVFATGAQVYVCTAPTDAPDRFAWTFKAPEAALWNAAGERVGSHSDGPTWTGNDGSAAVGEAVARADATDPGAIPWLLLRAASHDGAGAFSSVTYIQRLETAGGVAPAEGCDRSAAGAERAVPYTATYAFYYGATP